MYRWLNEESQLFLERGYLLPGQTVDERVSLICSYAEEKLGGKIKGFAGRFKENFQKGWYSFSTPVWTNFGTERGLPISCFGTNIEDSMDSILEAYSEIGMMTKHGGGTSAYFGNLRPRGTPIKNNGESSGAVHFMRAFDGLVDVISQGNTRRGNIATYLPVDHPDIEEFLTIRAEGSPIQHISFGITVKDKWMQSMIDGDMDKRRIWAKVLSCRVNTGYPYIVFIDNANNNRPDVYKDNNLEISHSNLCSEIMLPNSSTESFVCDLSSMNLLYYDEWKDTDAVELMIYFLDAVMTDFIERSSNIKYLERPNRFARRHRALGLGWMGWHSYLQSKMIPYESTEAKLVNSIIAKDIYDKAHKASRELAKLYGEPELLKGYGRRNTTLLAIAPTKSSAFIIGQVSEGIEPHKANYYIKDLQKGKFTIKNKHLEELLESKSKNTNKVWNSILENRGSVQHLDFLSDREKLVFKTFQEISPLETIIQAASRQKFIDQGQSLNLIIHPKTLAKDINALYIEAWKLGIKSLYYQISVNAAQELSRNILACSSCEA